MNIKKVWFFLGICLNFGVIVFAADWPQWRGPQRDGIATAMKLPAQWPNSAQPKWKIDVGIGQSSPIVASNSIYIFSREGEEEVLRSIDLATGKVIWRSTYSAPFEVYPGAASHGSGPKSTPVVKNGKIFTLGISGILSSFDSANGKLVWQKRFSERFKKSYPPFGTSMSPMILNGILVAQVGGHEGGAMIAFDPETGNEKWNWNGEGPSYSSPIFVQIENQPMIVTQVHRKIIAIDPANGKLLWSMPFVTPCDQNIVTPVVASDLLIFSSLDKGLFAVKVQRKQDQWIPKQIWHIQDVSLYMSTPVLANGRLVGFSHRKKGQFFSLDPQTGKVLWTMSEGSAENAAFIATGNVVLALKDDGELVVLDAARNTLETSARVQLSQTATWAHPVPVDDGLLIKDNSSLSLFRF